MILPEKIIFATKNKHKIEEVDAILSKLNIKLLSYLDFPDCDDIEENGSTFEENAFIKAEAVYNKYKLPALADDSGLCVDALGGAPGIFSARFAGEGVTMQENKNKLIASIKGLPAPVTASFHCCMVYYDGKEKIVSLGVLNGRIETEEKGQNGFGYDPLFTPDGYSKRLAELTPDEKNSISHRFLAVTGLVDKFKGKE